MRDSRARRALRVLMFGVGVLVMMLPATSWAACEPGRTHNNVAYNAGWFRTVPGGGTAQGAYSLIFEYDPWVVQAEQAPGATAWIGLFNGGGTYYGIAGWWVDYGIQPGVRDRALMAEHDRPDAPRVRFRDYTLGHPIGTSTYYSVYYNPTNDELSFYHAIPGQTSVKIIQNVVADFTPTQARNYSAISTLINQMPGASTVPETFRDTHIRYSGQDFAFAGTRYNSSETYFGVSIPSTGLGLVAETWDKACTV